MGIISGYSAISVCIDNMHWDALTSLNQILCCAFMTGQAGSNSVNVYHHLMPRSCRDEGKSQLPSQCQHECPQHLTPGIERSNLKVVSADEFSTITSCVPPSQGLYALFLMRADAGVHSLSARSFKVRHMIGKK